VFIASKRKMEKLTSKNILIVGATGGIGRNLAKQLVQSGARVYLAARNRPVLTSIGEDLDLPSERLFTVDMTDDHSIGRMGEDIHRQVPYIDILVNTAGIGIIKPLDQLSLADFQQTIQVNLTGTFLLVKTFLPAMRKAGKGLIINIPGVLGKVPMAGAAAYSASKYGLQGMMQSIREELKRTEIRITNIYLGGVDSPFWDNIELRVQKEKMISAEEAARAIWFLCQQPVSGVVSELVLQPFNHQVI
jgi:short-subunit dehydrogenase